MTGRADLHVHTNASDGALPPAEVVKTAAEAGLAAVGITDHDTVAGLDEALEAGERLGIVVVPGVEISTIYGKNAEAHILGYFMDHHDSVFAEKLRVLKDARWERGRMMVERLQAVGVPIDFDRVQELADGGAVGRPHVARALCEVGAASSLDAAFGRYLVEGAPGYVERMKVTPQEAVRMILDAGGVPCCAHAGKLKDDALLVDLMDCGLKGIEAYHPDHSSAACRSYAKFGLKNRLIVTGGSDAHCISPEHHGGIGSVTVDASVVEQLRQAAD